MTMNEQLTVLLKRAFSTRISTLEDIADFLLDNGVICFDGDIVDSADLPRIEALKAHVSEQIKDGQTMSIHNLKILPRYFIDVLKNIKTFEVRKNDRDYKVGDILLLREYIPTTGNDGSYTGAVIKRTVTYILDNPEYVKQGYVILGLGCY